MLRRRLLVAAAVALLGGAIAWRLGSSRPDAEAASDVAWRDAPVRWPLARKPDETDAPRPSDESGSAPERDGVAVGLRVRLNGIAETEPPLPISARAFRPGQASRITDPTTFGFAATQPLDIRIDDPRAAVRRIGYTVPIPAPKTLEFSIPLRSDPRLDPLVIEVVDDVTGEPLPSATLELFPLDAAAHTIAADELGRVTVPLVRDAHGARSPLASLSGSSSCVRAPGHLVHEWRAHVLYAFERDDEHAADGADLVSLAEHGVIRVRLQPYPEKLQDRRVRIVHADGRAAFDVRAIPLAPLSAKFGRMPVSNGWRTPDAGGTIDIPDVPVVGLEVRRLGAPVAVWVLSASSQGGVRELRLPPLCEVTVLLSGAPAQGGWWSLDEFDVARVPIDGPPLPPTYDPGTEQWLAQRELLIPTVQIDHAGPFAGERPSISFAVPVDVLRRLWLTEGVLDPLESDERLRRTVDVFARTPGPLRIERRWDELPVVR